MSILDQIIRELDKQRRSDTSNYSDMGNYEVLVCNHTFPQLVECFHTRVARKGLGGLVDLKNKQIAGANVYSVHHYPVPFRVVRV
jgi:hypothetical protein